MLDKQVLILISKEGCTGLHGSYIRLQYLALWSTSPLTSTLFHLVILQPTQAMIHVATAHKYGIG